MPKTPVFVKFHHGLGDVTQATVILKHLRKYRPEWEVHFWCGRGKHSIIGNLCHKVWHDQEPEPQIQFKHVFELGFFENLCCYEDRPGSKVTNCLAEVFNIEWDESLGRYECSVSDQAYAKAQDYLLCIGCKEAGRRNNRPYYRSVLLHYQGNTSSHRKNLQHWQAQELCEAILASGRVPIIMDWDNRSSIPNERTIFCPRVDPNDIWGGFGSGDAEIIAALIRMSEAYVGIDSGPGKVASSTDTPTLICWTGHHPTQFHDPADNTVHLIPDNHRDMSPVAGHPRMSEWFEKHYKFRTYREGQQGLIVEAKKWLEETLSFRMPQVQRKLSYVLPNGIGDTVWALHKIQAINKDVNDNKPIDIILSGPNHDHINHRSVPFLRRFPFINDIKVMDVPVLRDRENPTDERGRYRYEPDGRRGEHFFLVPNAVLERGERLENWMPEYHMDWDIMKQFSFKDTEVGLIQAAKLGKFVAFYLGPETGNVDEGHNRGFLWEPKDWTQIGWEFTKLGYKIAVVGADYDRSYWERYVRDGVRQAHMEWTDLIGAFEIGETFRFLKEAACLVSYQCGLAICLHYLGGKVVSWWRPDGDSIHPRRQVCFDERMKDAWVRPEYKENYMGCIYKRETPEDIIKEIGKRNWLK